MRALPTPAVCLASKIATSIDHLAAYRGDDVIGRAVQVGGNQRQVVSAPFMVASGLADQHDADLLTPEGAVPQATPLGDPHMLGAAAAGDDGLSPVLRSGQVGGGAQPFPLKPGPSPLAGSG
ncbi:MAG: hypothetical protein ACRDYA_17420 [Egibacteraceae bacterium]